MSAKGELEQASTTAGLPVAPSLGPSLAQLPVAPQVPLRAAPVDMRVVFICLVCAAIGLASGVAAQALIRLIYFFTNLAFYHRLTFRAAVAAGNHLGAWVIIVPVIGAIAIGLLARYGSRAVAGHGIPEAMEQVLINQSRIPARMTFLKPISAAISIGTGGPFGAEGPIIASGGALGSLVGQLMRVTDAERKVLLAAGASSGIAAAFGAPVAAVLLAIELLLFEFRARSIIPVAIACAGASLLHILFEGSGAFFQVTGGALLPATGLSLTVYVVFGCIIGVAAVVMTRAVYAVEHFFEHVPVHWMWHPAIGAVAVGVIGWIAPATLGPGYFNLDHLLSRHLAVGAIAVLGILKFLSWTISLGSGTSGGTLAPVFTIGGCVGACLGLLATRAIPSLPIDPRVAALVGMVAIFAGSSRALLTSVAFAIETTQDPAAGLPALAGCCAAYLVSALIMRHSIMTEKMARQGVRVPADLVADFLDRVVVSEVCCQNLVSLKAQQSVADVRQWLMANTTGRTHQGFPVLDETGHLVGVVTKREIFDPNADPGAPVASLIRRAPIIVYGDSSLRDAADHMANHDIGRLPVIQRGGGKVIGMITRSDLLRANRLRLDEHHNAAPPSFRPFRSRADAT